MLKFDNSSCYRNHLTHCLAGAAFLAIVLAPMAQAAEFPQVIELSSLNGSNGFRLDGVAAGDESGISAASAGDVNGDGFTDLIIGARGADPRGLGSGSSYVVFGRASGFDPALQLSNLDGTNGFRLDGVRGRDDSGGSVASAGDVNGDGFADVIVGATGADPNGSYSGASYVVFGKASGFASSIRLASLNGRNGFRLDGAAPIDYTGEGVASAGDVNRDGFADVIVSAFFAGKTYVVFGKASGFASALQLSGLDGTNGFRLDSGPDGVSVSATSAGDVNGDGFADMIVGDFTASPHGHWSGSTYVVFGKASSYDPVLQLSSLDGTNGFRLDGVRRDDISGISVASAGDVDGDGFADVIIGARDADPNGSYSGASYVVFGKASGFASSIRLASLNGRNGFRLDGVAAYDRSANSVASAGDVNGDGFADVIVGATGTGPHGLDSGSSYVVFGKASGFASHLQLSSLDGGNGFRLDGVAAGDNNGISVASAGDINGDGFADVIVGAWQADPNGDRSGSSYVLFGRAPDAAVSRVGGAASQYISGGRFGDSLSGLGRFDVLEGRRGADALDGGRSNNDTASYAHSATGVIANLATPSVNTGDAFGDTYTAIENLTGSSFDDRLTGDGLTNWITGLAGKDRMNGGVGPDFFVFDKPSDSSVGATRDMIDDFDAGTATTSVDRIDLHKIDAKTGVLGDQAFSFIGATPFSNTQGELRVSSLGTTAIVAGDTNGDGTADFEIGLSNVSDLTTLTAVDFLR